MAAKHRPQVTEALRHIKAFFYCVLFTWGSIVAQSTEATAASGNGKACQVDSDCKSGDCSLGPNARPGGGSRKYCVRNSTLCAWKGTPGFEISTLRKSKIEYLCARVRGGREQFSSIDGLVGLDVEKGTLPENYFFAKLSSGVGKHRECRQSASCRACLLRAPFTGHCIQEGNDLTCEARKLLRKGDCERLKTTEMAQAEPLEFAIHESRKSAVRAGVQGIPIHIRDKLRVFYPKSVLDSVRFRIGSRGALDVQRFAFDSGASAVTLDNVIVFDSQNDADDVCTWAHELEHVIQYRRLGVDGFAQRYVQPAKRGNYNPKNIGSLEGSAEARRVYVCGKLGL
ncbi:DUF4157 domain-containing protein [Mesorhizobium sp. B2-4-9]|uniref:eCIS core domain-containing protein n=1 Tax=Mesorhizobium sp. B2-4-9 TaxID=2589940 RepID=UPI0015E3F961|nr:DUF4157 domain-containing protein [Mesorhizobium sp. B2-4-9]